MRANGVAITLAFLGAAALASPPGRPTSPTFEERLRAQEAIERVYHSYQPGSTRTFEEAVPRDLLERKVRAYLRESVALEQYWKTPITAEALRRELERITANTRFPARLREIEDALGRDPVLIQECFVRPVLADRLARNFFALDDRVHEAARRQAEELRRRLLSGEIDPASERPGRRVVEQSEGDIDRRRGVRAAEAGTIGPIVEDRDAFSVSVVLSRGDAAARIAVFEVPKLSFEEWWSEAQERFDEKRAVTVAASLHRLPEPSGAAPCATPAGCAEPASSFCVPDDTWDNGILDDNPIERSGHTAVWTGSLMIVWGGGQFGVNGTGSRYDPLTDTWSQISTINAPRAVFGDSAVWTGREMIVWGGYDQSVVPYVFPRAGGRYDPTTDTWTPTSEVNAPEGRSRHSAVWTGREMIVWGGFRSPMLNSGGRYDPSTDTWTPTSIVDAPQERYGHTAIWTGREMIVWGGAHDYTTLNTGARFDPEADTWTPTSIVDAPEGRIAHTAVWTGREMIVWGGGSVDPGINLDTGARYDPAADSWTATSLVNAPEKRNTHTVIWTGSEMIVFGGHQSFVDADIALDTGGRYDPATDSWRPTSLTNASDRTRHTAVWTGSLMIVWGGDMGNRISLRSGSRYDPSADTWTPTSPGTGPTATLQPTAVWTGTVMIVWGGGTRGGSRYDPLVDAWTPTTLIGAPFPRFDHTAIWTGDAMIVWGGSFGDTGGRYDPTTDSWTPTSTAGAPSARSRHTAVWTGNRMIVWGGTDGSLALDTGARYDPASDLWQPLSSDEAPSPRESHTAIWMGSRMIVWGGLDFATGYFNSGGSYDPDLDRWTATSLAGAPSPRASFTAVWTGSEMIVWGGALAGSIYNDGGRYDPMADSWGPMSAANAPFPRYGHTAIWTGSVMIVWAGRFLETGGRYDPASDTWKPTSTVNAPILPRWPTAVWTGDFMIGWARGRGGRYALGQQIDADGDNVPVCGGDCDDSNPQVWSPAVEVAALAITSAAPTGLIWTDQRTLVGPETVYDLTSGLLSSAGGPPFSSSACLQTGQATSFSDARPDPASGSAYWYLVRARNSCGVGTYGSAGEDSAITACP